MSGRVPWAERRWAFDFPAGNFADVLERLRGTPARLEERLSGAAGDRCRFHEGTRWSVLENLGHLGDVEDLWQARTGEILAGAARMSAADMTNRRTAEAGHDRTPIPDLLARFRAARMRWVERLEGLGEADFARASHHPRLDRPMRLVDLCVFVADHDDHHLARIAALLRP